MRKILAAAVLAAISASLISAAPAQAQTPIKIMVGGIDKQIYLPAKLAAQLGFFKEQGLDVELFNSNSGSQAGTASSPNRAALVESSADRDGPRGARILRKSVWISGMSSTKRMRRLSSVFMGF